MANNGRSATKALKTTRSLTGDAAYSLLAVAPEVADRAGLSGVYAVADGNGMLLGLLAIGEKPTPTNVAVVLDKIKTVVATHRSSRLQAERMKKNNQSPSDFGGALGSLFGGGVALFADKEKTEFVGAHAFSGGTPFEDEDFCLDAIRSSDLTLYSDVDKG